MKAQRGLTLVGLIFILGLCAMTALLGFKMLPAYLEFFNVKRIVADIAASPQTKGATIKQVQQAFDQRAVIDSIASVKGSDLEVEKSGDGYILSISWEKKVPLIHNVSALVEFEVES